MRKVNANQFLKILKGEDLEFRISAFSFSLTQPVTVDGIHLPYDVNFDGCDLNELDFSKCRFSGHLSITNSTIKSLSFLNCQHHNLSILSSSVGNLKVCHSSELRALIVKASHINELTVDQNPVYESIHIGCENNIRACLISNNGDIDVNSFSTKVFICPERFEKMVLSNLTTEALHIGNFGEYAKFTVKDVRAEVVLIDNCSTELSKVHFENIRPLNSSVSALHFVNTTFDQDVFGEGAFKDYQVTKIHHQSVDVSSLIAR